MSSPHTNFGIESASMLESAVSNSRIGRFFRRFLSNKYILVTHIYGRFITENRGDIKRPSGYATEGLATCCDAAHLRWDVLKPLRFIKMCCDAFFNMLVISVPILEYLSFLLSDFQSGHLMSFHVMHGPIAAIAAMTIAGYNENIPS